MHCIRNKKNFIDAVLWDMMAHKIALIVITDMGIKARYILSANV